MPEFVLLRLYEQRHQAMEMAAERVRERKPESAIRFLKISEQDKNDSHNGFYQIKKHEFVWQGVMYDIVSEIKTGDFTWYLVYPDREETEAVAQIRQMNDFRNEHQSNAKSGQEVPNYFNWFISRPDLSNGLLAVSIRTPFVAQSVFLPDRVSDSIKKPPQNSLPSLTHVTMS